MDTVKNFEDFMDCWRSLPRSHHRLLPSRSDCTPLRISRLMANIAIFRYNDLYQMNLIFAGSELERLSGAKKQVSNYYDLVSNDSREELHNYHTTLLSIPCGAYAGDMITTRSGNQYLFETMQFPLSDDNGNVRYLLAYGHSRMPIEKGGHRDVHNHSINNIRDCPSSDKLLPVGV